MIPNAEMSDEEPRSGISVRDGTVSVGSAWKSRAFAKRRRDDAVWTEMFPLGRYPF